MRYTPDHAGVGRLLRSDGMRDAMTEIARRGAAHAATIAPKRTGDYASSFVSDAELQPGSGGVRWTGIVGNTDPGAAAIEWGARGSTGHHVLGRTADWLENGG